MNAHIKKSVKKFYLTMLLKPIWIRITCYNTFLASPTEVLVCEGPMTLPVTAPALLRMSTQASTDTQTCVTVALLG